mmetsp:Transcript_19947/g.50949  ORF Transcript_19947/g.50949 Transcript_19947/m.50949 type:complete len:144 (-) Transcript_19947:135-566(-)
MVDLTLASIPASLILAYIPHVAKGFFLVKTLKKYNNVMPREMVEDKRVHSTESGKTALRCLAAHQNGLEAFASFSAAVLAAKAAGLPTDVTDPICMGFLALRVVYNVLYMTNTNEATAGLRSLSWFGGMGATLTLMYKAAMGN